VLHTGASTSVVHGPCFCDAVPPPGKMNFLPAAPGLHRIYIIIKPKYVLLYQKSAVIF
jgi:hypothetical protein